MKIAIALCLLGLVAMVYGQGGRPAAGGGSSDALRAMMASRMLRGGAGQAGGAMGRMGGLSTLMMLRGGLDPMEFMLCRTNMMLCLMMMN